MMKRIRILFVVVAVLLVSCNEQGSKSRKAEKSKIEGQTSKDEKRKTNDEGRKTIIPKFSADSAYSYIEKQLSFGPRVPNTDAHKNCGLWLEEKFTSFGADVIVQKAKVEAYDGSLLDMSNIIARFQPEKANRLLLMAHWDSRPFADHDPDPARRNHPIPGANDGASGVGVLLEIGRLLGESNPHLGIDIILFDAEDYGVPDHLDIEWNEDSWCLGSQYWSRNPHVKNYYARYGILLDMVGAQNAVFTQEEVSVYYAKSVLEKVWKKAREMGYSNYFSYEKTPQIVDDHRYVNEIIGIPSIDIIQYDHSTESNFGPFWHTHNDDLQLIDKKTLKAVGEVVLNVIFAEN